MNDKEVSKNLKTVIARLAQLATEKAPQYETCNKYVPTIGYVSEMETKRECAKALSLVRNKCVSELASAEILGMSADEVEDDINFMGFSYEVWQSDIQKRVDELRKEETIAKLEKAKAVLTKYLSAEEKFAIDLESITEAINRV